VTVRIARRACLAMQPSHTDRDTRVQVERA
jgi:hypothetical protein